VAIRNRAAGRDAGRSRQQHERGGNHDEEERESRSRIEAERNQCRAVDDRGQQGRTQRPDQWRAGERRRRECEPCCEPATALGEPVIRRRERRLRASGAAQVALASPKSPDAEYLERRDRVGQRAAHAERTGSCDDHGDDEHRRAQQPG